jgi:beta-galactosidase
MSADIDRRGMLALTTVAALSLGTQARAAQPAAGVVLLGRDQPFDQGWLFRRGEGTGQEAPGLDDSGWRAVELPHDWGVEDIPDAAAPNQIGPFDRHAVGGTAVGFTVGGEGWYRKHFRLDGVAADARVELLFDGIMVESDVWLNGQHLGGSLSGYRPFALDLTPALNRTGDNVLAVRARNLGENSRWYAGSGLYRQVRLDVLPAGTRIARWGVGAWTRSLANGGATIAVTTKLDDVVPGLVLSTRLRDAAGAVVAESHGPALAETEQVLQVRGPHLWSPDSPYLYTLETELARDGHPFDRLVQPFGVRIITIDPQRGLAINGVKTQLRGGCMHHDNGLLGACAWPEADERRIRLLKARGFTAIRSSHNTPSRSLREACDRVGMLLIAEAFDAWNVPKLPQDFSVHFPDHWQEVVQAMVGSCRNSPSVFAWSIGNEIPYRSTDTGVEWQWKLANAVRRLDPTRPVTAGLNGVLGQEMIAGEGTARPGRAGKLDNASTIFLDLPGYNYRLPEMQREHPVHPERVVYASETFAKNAWDYQALYERAPWFLGEFVWTAIDYIGEAGCGANALIKANQPYYMPGWPWVNAWCGDLDLIGRQKAPSLARDVAWDVSPVEVCVARPVPEGMHEFIANWGWPDEAPSWTWPGLDGKPLQVRVYTKADRVELRLNGQVVAQRALTPADKGNATFAVAYAPGTLTVRAWRGDRMIGEKRLDTAGAAARIGLEVERRHGHGRGLAYVALSVLDAQARVLPDDQRTVALTVEGPARLLAFGNANPRATVSLQQPSADIWRGHALAILRTTGPGEVRVSASGEGLPPARIAFPGTGN